MKVFSRRGLTPEEVGEGQKITNIEDIFDADAIFFCVAISAFEPVLLKTQPYQRKDTIYFDTCSVKVKPSQWMQKYLPEGSQIIATHPMFGPDSYYNASEKLPMVMSNITAGNEEFKMWTDYFSSKPIRVEKMTPDEHDEMVAYSQGITHYVGRVLADLNLSSTKINTLGYQKLLEIIEQTCNDTWQLFLDLQRFNPYTRKMRIDLHGSLEKIYELLNNNHLE